MGALALLLSAIFWSPLLVLAAGVLILLVIVGSCSGPGSSDES